MRGFGSTQGQSATWSRQTEPEYIASATSAAGRTSRARVLSTGENVVYIIFGVLGLNMDLKVCTFCPPSNSHKFKLGKNVE